jgi:hypothetical protein
VENNVRKIALSGLIALTALVGGAVAVPATAMAQPSAGVRPVSAVPARPDADAVVSDVGGPKISCVLATDCLAVKGSSALTGNGTTPTRVARWNGSSWKDVGVPLPKGTKSDDLTGVSCRGTTFCLVVGDYYKGTSSSSPSNPLALIYNGSSLKATAAVPVPKGASNVALTDVSCTSARYCVAVGITQTTANGYPPALLETWNGAKWTLHAIASSATTEVQPAAVSCATPAFCVLTGSTTFFNGTTFAFRVYLASWNGSKLTTMKSALSASAKSLPAGAGVSCDTPAHCAVTGLILSSVTTNSANVNAFTETWNGKAWQTAKTTWPKGVAASITLGASCYGGRTCVTVGEYATSNANTAPFEATAVSYVGSTGTVQAVPAPSKGHSTDFTSVSCLPWGTCIAVGQTGKTNATVPSIMTGVWNGKTWKLDPGF